MNINDEKRLLRNLLHRPHPLFKDYEGEQNAEMLEAVKKLVFHEQKMPELFQTTMEKFHADSTHVFHALLPLFQLGLNFDLAIAGGAVRDLFLEREIKDLDFVLSIEDHTLQEIFKSISVQKIEKVTGKNAQHFIEQWKLNERQELHAEEKNNIIEEHIDYSQHFYDLVQFCLQGHLEVEKSFEPKLNVEEIEGHDHYRGVMTERRLSGVIKLDDNKLHYPGDILITNLSVSTFVNKFDFNLCKAYLYVVDKDRPIERPQCAADYLYHLNVTPSFVQDFMDKTLTLDMHMRENIKSIEVSMGDHYERIQVKYPEYKLNLNAGNVEEYQIWKNHFELNQALPQKQTTARRMKI